MARAHGKPFYERLSALDAVFLSAEDENAHMHVGSVGIVEAAPLTLDDGQIDAARIYPVVLQMLNRAPRMRQKLWRPDSGLPVWIDDPEFRLSYHFRHTALPRPGSERQLKRLTGRILSQSLDLTKPPWEIWLVEGLEGDRIALIAKIHHCLADGITVRNILTGYLGLAPVHQVEGIDDWTPRPAPSLGQLRRDGLRDHIEKSRALTQSVGRLLGESDLRSSLLHAAGSLIDVASNLIGEVSHTPLNRRIGPHRRIDWTRSDFAQVKKIRARSGAKVNDVVLACVTGAVRRFLLGRKLRVDDLDFRVMVPVSLRGPGGDTTLGNRVSNMTVTLPLFETDPRRRLRRITEATARAKSSSQSAVGDVAAQLADIAGLLVPRSLAQRAAHQVAANMVVTNVPGPPFPLYMLDSKMLASYPIVPLSTHQALGVALYSYDGGLHWGLNADWDAVPDLHDFVAAIEASFDELVAAHVPVDVRSAGEPQAAPPQTADEPPKKAASARRRARKAPARSAERAT